MKLPEQVNICEVSTRDGFQTMPCLVDACTKAKIIHLAEAAGVKTFEVGSFIRERENGWRMHNTPEVFSLLDFLPDVRYRALLQTPIGAADAIESGCRYFKINISASTEHYRMMTGKTPLEAMAGFGEIGRIAAENGATILGAISLAFVSPYDAEITDNTIADIISRFIDCGATEISLNDTAGMATPVLVSNRFRCMIEKFSEIKTWAFHSHNTRGTGLANVIAALDAGVTQLDSSLAGIGGCTVFKNASGNISTEDLVYLLNNSGVKTGIDMQKIILAGQFVETVVEGKIATDSYIQRIEHIRAAGDYTE